MISSADPARPSEAGFTLVEMIVVIVIIGLATTLIVAGRNSPVSPGMRARMAAAELAGDLRAARGEAVVANRTVGVTVDVAKRTYAVGAATPTQLPRELLLSVLTAQDQIRAEGKGGIGFFADGSSTGGRVTIQGGDEIWMVGIDWISGRVSVERAASP